MSKIKAVIFDMDGVLIDSEPLWRDVELRVFRSLGIPLTLEMAKETMGLKIDSTIDYWLNRFPYEQVPRSEIVRKIEDGVCFLIDATGKAKPGVYKVIMSIRERRLLIAIASSSPRRIIQAVINKLEISSLIDYSRSGEDDHRGKPAPDIYINTARMLNVRASECLVFEDSPVGVASAKAAGMYCIAIPDKEVSSDERFKMADSIIGSFDDFVFPE